MVADGVQVDKPELTIASLGHAGHGKTTMAGALVRILAKPGDGQAQAGETVSGSGIHRFEYETSRRRYRHLDCPAADVPDLLKTHSLDGAVLVMSAMDSVMPQTREHVSMARAADVPLFAFLNKCEQVDDPELLDLVEMELRELLNRAGYDGDNGLVVRGSAQAAMLGDGFWTGAFHRLADALDESLPQGRQRTTIPPRARLVAKHSGKVLDVAGGPGTADNGASVHQWEWKGGDNQKWGIEPAGEGYYRLVAKHSGKVLDVAGGPGTADNGASVHQWEWKGGDNQKWGIEPAGEGYYRLVAKHSGKVLDVAGGPGTADNGASVHQWEWKGGDNQKWRLDPIQDSDW
ncbi:RICIN domain-containing protein [Streptomyces sp. NPDC002209]|uniref:RICIN domain-containing protein n=1 Tax=Streptomyces sp. NPDC002209 TaxID=3364638 RepID=UPI0036ADB0DB